jgi:hypothetical protein
MRRSLEETWQILAERGMFKFSASTPSLPPRMPSIYDEELIGIHFFRTQCGFDLSDLSLPRTFMGRSYFVGTRFNNSDLSESRMCWNDFTNCDFSGADLSRCDMRASHFEACIFRNADLSGADLRRSSFTACIFQGANFTGTIACKASAAEDLIPLLEKLQRRKMRWVHDDGEEPPGG